LLTEPSGAGTQIICYERDAFVVVFANLLADGWRQVSRFEQG
jgi:hypothetical protein